MRPRLPTDRSGNEVESDVQLRRGVRDPTDRDDVDSGFGDWPDVVESDRSRCFGHDLSVDDPDGLPQCGDIHVVEHHPIGVGAEDFLELGRYSTECALDSHITYCLERAIAAPGDGVEKVLTEKYAAAAENSGRQLLIQEMFRRFVEIEEGHQKIVQAEIDCVSGAGFWFDSMEFKLEGA